MSGGLPEDLKKTVLVDDGAQYMVFIIDEHLEKGQILPALEAARKRAIQLCMEYADEYMWQRDGFKLEVRSEQGLLFLRGSTDYGDCVEDEWLLVFLLRELSKSVKNSWIRIFDSDGEFLLIEAAKVVPKWLNPENDLHRVWIHAGELRIIPPGRRAGGETGSVSLVQAVENIRDSASDLLHSPLVEAEALYRLEKYPAHITASAHHTLATIPRKLASILHDRPKALAPAVEAFYLRDLVAMRPILSASPQLTFPPTDMVTVSTRFTKTLFAQLKSQHLVAPPSWQHLIEVAEGKEYKNRDGIPEKDLLEVGMKLTVGFEILLARTAASNSRLVHEIALVLQDLQENGNCATLPSDEDIRLWEGVNQHDDDAWLDINFDDFEQELEGGRSSEGRYATDGQQEGFGNTAAQADLRKIVERFESFLNDDRAGLEGVEEVEDMDEDDGDEEDHGDSEEEDRDVGFDEVAFEDMMRQMMGMPGSDRTSQSNASRESKNQHNAGAAADVEDEEILRLSEQLGSELDTYGALTTLDAPAVQKLSQAGTKGHGDARLLNDGFVQSAPAPILEDEDSAEEEVDVDYNLAKNLLESFKGQTGMPGPTGNILRMMGLSLPRDEDEDGEDDGLHHVKR